MTPFRKIKPARWLVTESWEKSEPESLVNTFIRIRGILSSSPFLVHVEECAIDAWQKFVLPFMVTILNLACVIT